MDRKPNRNIVPVQKGLFSDLALRIKLVARLLGDRRVSFWLKLLPIGAVAYLLSPFDIIPDIALPVIGMLDDAAVIWLGYYLFLELAPTEVVKEHLESLTSNNAIVENAGRKDDDDVVDAEVTDDDK